MTRAELQTLVNSVADQILGPPREGFQGPARFDAAPRGVPTPSPSAAALAATIDHTNLKPEAQREEIARLCQEALQWNFATVCVHSIWVPLAHSILRGSAVKVCTVTGFPTGAVPAAVKRLEAEIALRNGAKEIDMVLPVGLLRRGELDIVQHDIQAVAELTRNAGAVLKVILESAALEDREITIACALSRLAGAQFVKTSTGFHAAGGARPEHVSLMRRVVGDELGVKASGGIRTLEDALAMLAAGANRLGMSASVAVLESLREKAGG